MKPNKTFKMNKSLKRMLMIMRGDDKVSYKNAMMDAYNTSSKPAPREKQKNNQSDDSEE